MVNVYITTDNIVTETWDLFYERGTAARYCGHNKTHKILLFQNAALSKTFLQCVRRNCVQNWQLFDTFVLVQQVFTSGHYETVL